MEPGWLPVVSDVVKTGIAGVQAAAAWRPARLSEGGEDDAWMVPGASVAVAGESGPEVVCGREDLVGDLVGQLGRRGRERLRVLVGAGGMGKSTIARRVAVDARRDDPQRLAWWISAVNEERLSDGLVSLAREVGASPADQEAIRTRPVAHLGDIADRVWRLLEKSRPGWLLVIDNADDPSLLGPSDGTGWIRRAGRGLLLVTSRNGDETCWPSSAVLTTVGPLSVDAATNVLIALAPDAGDRAAAQGLAVRLGCLPQALRMAGMYLRRQFSAWPTFDDYHRALDREGFAQVIQASQRADRRALITQTWELSLDALAASGVPQARPMLWLLSCYAPGSQIPVEVVTAPVPADDRHSVAPLVDPQQTRSPQEVTFDCLDGLHGLASVGLIQCSGPAGGAGHIELHPFIAEVTRTVLDAGDRTEVDPSLVRDCAVAAVHAAVGKLEVGDAEHWPRFYVLTSHVQHLLAGTAHHLRPPQRRILLDCVTRCVASYMWSRAEQRAEQLAFDALALGRELGCEDTEEYLRLRQTYGWALREQGRLVEAADVLSQVLAAQTELPGGMTRADTLRTRHDLAWTTGRQGRWAEAEQELRQVLLLRRKGLQDLDQGGDDADVLHTRCMLCWCIGKRGNWAAAERGYRELVTDRAAILGPEHADTLDTRESLGKTLAWQQRWADAEAEFHTLVTGRTRTLGEQHPDTLLSRQLEVYAAGYQALTNNDRKARRSAQTQLEQIVDTQRAVRGNDHQNTIDGTLFLTVLRSDYSPTMPWTEDLPRPNLNEQA